MKKVEIRNKTLLEELRRTEFLFKDNRLDDFLLTGENFTKEQAFFWTGPTHLKEILQQGTSHEGFPEFLKSYSVQNNTFRLSRNPDAVRLNETLEEIESIRTNLSHNWMFRQNALWTIYPPGGFISWHNNANASSYNLIFTYSEKGEGNFSWLDRTNGKIIVMKDHAGWQGKYGYFSNYNEDPKKLMYHSARTDCWRMTIAFILDRSEWSKLMQSEIIQDIETE